MTESQPQPPEPRSSGSSPGVPSPALQPKKKAYVRAVSPRLRKLLYVVFGLLALIGANSFYLSTITFLEWWRGQTLQNYFYQYMFLGHLALGLLLIVPFIVFGVLHLLASRNRRNRRAVRIGYALFFVSIGVLVTGLLLTRIGGFDLRQPLARSTIYWLHVACPLVVGWLYWLHRLAGPRIKWRVGGVYAAVVGAAAVVMVLMHSQDPRKWYAVGPASGAKYFEPSLIRTTTGNFVSAENLMNDQYCKKCHADVHAGWSASAHRFSSFNNPAYLASVKEVRDLGMKRDGNVQASRWCAGCHDPVPFLSGAFDDPNFDLVNHPTAKAGITCTACHAITNINSTKGNADFTVDEPLHYPFAFSDNAALQWINNQLIKAKPSFHKATFLKPFHKEKQGAEFCAGCHKVHLPYALNHYKEFLRGQNHYDPYLLSGVSGHGARSFYYPPEAKENCAKCHMPLVASDDFGARYFDNASQLSVHNHLFPSANTAVAWLRNDEDTIRAHQKFLEGVVRVDIVGVRKGGQIDGQLIAPLRPEVPTLVPGQKYLFETVVRTLKMGHLFTQGTVDSNEVWLDVTVTSGDRVIGRSGGLDATRGNEVDRWAHFLNVFMLDKDGNRINRRNAQDIFTPLYNHQIPPGAGQTAHYELQLPADLQAPITVAVKLQYRKFDQEYMQIVDDVNAKLGQPIRGHEPGKAYVNNLPITTLAVDSVTFPVQGVDAVVDNPTPDIPVWQRWNDYGIGQLLKGKAELRQAEEAFVHVEQLGRFDGPLNLARVYLEEGRLDDAVEALNRAKQLGGEGFPVWTWAWLAGSVARQQGFPEVAEKNLRSVLEDRTPEMEKRKFDFSLDYEVINLHGQVLFELGQKSTRVGARDEANRYYREALQQFQKTLQIDSENITAHYNLQLLYAALGEKERAAEHGKLHQIYKLDDNAQGEATRLARERYPAANFAAEAVVRYPLRRPGAPGLPEQAATEAPQPVIGPQTQPAISESNTTTSGGG